MLERTGLTANDHQALKEFAATVRAKLGDRVCKIALFGSKARGTAGSDSDLDVLLIVHGRSKEVNEVIREAAFTASLTHDVLLSPVVFEESDYESPLNRATAFYRNAKRESVTI